MVFFIFFYKPIFFITKNFWVKIFCFLFKNFYSFSFLFTYNNWRIFFNNASFFICYFFILEPRKFVWSIDISLIIVTIGFFITLVASSLPPNPVSNIVKSAGFFLKAKKAAAVVISKNVIFWFWFTLNC